MQARFLSVFLVAAILSLNSTPASAQVTAQCVPSLSQYKADSTQVYGYQPGSRPTMEKRLIANTIFACNYAKQQAALASPIVAQNLAEILTRLQNLAAPVVTVRVDTVRITTTTVRVDSLYCVGTPCVWSTTPPIVTPPPDPTPVPPPTGGGGLPMGMPNLPPGLTVFADINGDEADGFISLPNANMDIWDRVTKQQDATAPKSPSTVRRFTIRAGSGQGGTGKVEVHFQTGWNGGIGVQEVYMARWLKPSPNLIGDPAGSKSLYLMTNNGTVYFNYQTLPEGVLIRPILGAIGGPYNDVWLTRNRASTPLVRGQWGLWEFYAKMNTPGQANGILRVWANGVLQLEYTDIPYRTSSSDMWRYALSDFYQNTLQPFEMWWDMDHYFVAGR